MELKKAAAITGVVCLGYIGYGLVTAPTPKISRAETFAATKHTDWECDHCWELHDTEEEADECCVITCDHDGTDVEITEWGGAYKGSSMNWECGCGATGESTVGQIEWEIDDGELETTMTAETVKKDSCCCGATTSKPCTCMVEGKSCSGTCACASDKKEAQSVQEWILSPAPGHPVRKYEKTALQRDNFDAFKRQSDLLSAETKKLYEILATSTSVAESEAIKRAITEVYNAIDILHGGYWDYGAESFEAETICDECEVNKATHRYNPLGTALLCGDCLEKAEEDDGWNMIPKDEESLYAESFSAEYVATRCDSCEAIYPQKMEGHECECKGTIRNLYEYADGSADFDAESSSAEGTSRPYYLKTVDYGGAYPEDGLHTPFSEGIFTSRKAAQADMEKTLDIAKTQLDPEVQMIVGEDGIQYRHIWDGEAFGLQSAKCKWVKNRSHQGFTVHTAYGRWDIKYQPVKKLGAESFSADYEPDTYCDTGCGKKWVCEECERCEACCGCIEGECQVEDCEGTPCDECGFCDICEGGDINPCCARRTYGMRKGWGAESSSAEQVWVKNAEGNFLGPISEAEWSYLKHETEDVWEVEALTETAQWNEEDDDADDDAIAHYTTNFNNENLLAEYMTEGRKGGTSRFMDPKQVIDLFKKANGTLVSVTFVKRTNGEIRKMLARTSVRKGVKGVGLKFKPSDKNLMGVYDFGKVREGADPWKCYRFVPVDAVLTMRVRGKTYTA